MALSLVSETLSAIKNLIRLWHLSVGELNTQITNGSSSGNANPLAALVERPAMITLYRHLYSVTLVHVPVVQDDNHSSTTVTDDDEGDTHAAKAMTYNEVSRQACLILNYLIRGSSSSSAASSTSVPVINSIIGTHSNNSNCNSLQTLARGLLCADGRGVPLSNLLDHVRLLHVLVASAPSPGSANTMLHTVQSYMRQEQNGEHDETSTSTASPSTSTCPCPSSIMISTVTVPAVLIATLAWALRSGSTTSDNDNHSDNIHDNHDSQKKAELMQEIFNVLFAINMGAKLAATNNKAKEEEIIMTQLGILIGEVLQLPNSTSNNNHHTGANHNNNNNSNSGANANTHNNNNNMYRVKLACLNLLMDAPLNYAYYLHVNHVIVPHLVTILWRQVTHVHLLMTGGGGNGNGSNNNSPSSHDGPIVLPILVVLTKLCQQNPAVLQAVKAQVFPDHQSDNDTSSCTDGARGRYDCDRTLSKLTCILDTPSPYSKYTNISSSSSKQKQQTTATTTAISTSKHEEKEAGGIIPPNTTTPPPTTKTKTPDTMAPADAPRNTLRCKLIQLMTHTDSNVKRCASEFLWTLCGSSSSSRSTNVTQSEEFVKRTGFGNAVHMLSIKGLLQLPTKSTTSTSSTSTTMPTR
jgi:hypothetical protein